MSITDGQISTRQWFMISGSVSVNHLFSLSNKVLHAKVYILLQKWEFCTLIYWLKCKHTCKYSE